MNVKVISRKVNNMDFKVIRVQNDNNFQVDLLNYGATIKSVFLDGKIMNLTPDNWKGFIDCDSFYGKIVGRYAGRIENGLFRLNDVQYELDLNNGGNCLHGGINTISNKLFNYHINQSKDNIEVIFYLHDEENLFPGDVDFKITYTIASNENSILIDYNATSNKDTILNLTNHTYFNLSGNYKKTVLDEIMYIDADRFTKLKENMCLESIEMVNEVMDFRTPKKIGQDIEHGFLQNHPTKGYDHCYILNNKKFEDIKASLYDEESKIKLSVYTTYPCVVIYTCNYPSDKLVYHHKAVRKYDGVCFECQYMPNSINYSNETILRKGQIYHEKTKFVFESEECSL